MKNNVRAKDSSHLFNGDSEFMRSFFEKSPDALFVRDLDGKIFDCNPAALKMLGYSREEILSRHFEDMVVAGPGATREKINERLFTEGSVVFETKNKKKMDRLSPLLHILCL